MKYLILIPTIFIFFFASCKKKKDTSSQLPAATQIGANTFGCLINGELAKTSMYYSSWNSEGVEFTNLVGNYNYIYIHAQTKNPRRDFNFEIYFDGQLGTYTLYSHHNSKSFSCHYMDSTDKYGTIGGGINDYFTDANHNGTITFTRFDGNVVSAIFEMELVNINGEERKITSGRLDIKTP